MPYVVYRSCIQRIFCCKYIHVINRNLYQYIIRRNKQTVAITFIIEMHCFPLLIFTVNVDAKIWIVHKHILKSTDGVVDIFVNFVFVPMWWQIKWITRIIWWIHKRRYLLKKRASETISIIMVVCANLSFHFNTLISTLGCVNDSVCIHYNMMMNAHFC